MAILIWQLLIKLKIKDYNTILIERQKKLDADPKLIQEIQFFGQLKTIDDDGILSSLF